jgi:hypothetical protein
MDIVWRDLIGNFFGVKPPPPIPEEPKERRKDARSAAEIQATLEWFDADGRVCSVEGVLENVSSNGFAIRTEGEFEEGQTVWVTRPDSPALKSIVRHIQRSDGFYVLGLARIAKERRREDRAPIAGAGCLRRTGPRGECLSVAVQIRNISAEGLQLVSPESAPPQEVVRLVGSAVECTGTVRYSVPWNRRFLIGVFLIGKVHSNEPQDEMAGD